MSNWVLGQEHKYYGKVAMMRTIEGEPYRFFLKDGVVSMIPLAVLQIEEKNAYDEVDEDELKNMTIEEYLNG